MFYIAQFKINLWPYYLLFEIYLRFIQFIIPTEDTGSEMEAQVNYVGPPEGTKTLLEESGERHGHMTSLTKGSTLSI